MEKSGFGIFGRPVGLDYVSNGLFKKLQIENETYLDLPNNVNLAPGERIVSISRQASAEGQTELIKVYIFDYARSFNDRAGGFVGSAYVFEGNPTQALLYDAVRNLHGKALGLLDENKKFGGNSIEGVAESDLLNPNDPKWVQGSGRKISEKLKTDLYGVLTDGPVLNHLISVVQGFMYHPVAQQLTFIYVSDNKELLHRIVGNESKKILRVGHLLNFEHHFKKEWKKINEAKSEFNQINEKNAEERKEVKRLRDESNRVSKELEDKKRFSNKLEKEILSLQDQHKEWEQKNSRAKDAIKKLEEKQNAIKESNYTVFKSLLEAPKFKEEKFRYDKGNPEVLSLQDELRYFKAKEKEKKEKFWIKIAYLVGTGLLLLIGGYLLGNFKPIFNKRKEVEKENVAGVVTEDKINSLTLNLPKEYSTKKFLVHSPQEQEKHKEKLDKAISRLSSSENISEKSKDSLFSRKWNIGELIDPEKFEIDSVYDGMKRINKIKALYDKNGKSVDIFTEKLGLSELSETRDTTMNFSSNKRDEIITEYLQNDKNIYKSLGLEPELSFYKEKFDENLTVSEKQRKELLIYMHFRRMIHELNGEDLKTTTKKEFKVLVTK